MICPICYILFRIPSFFVNPEIYFLAFLPYFILSITVFYFMLGKRRYEKKDLLLGQLLSTLTFSVYIRAAVSALLGFKISFGVTGKEGAKAIPYARLWPQMAMIFISFITVVWGANRFYYERQPAILVNGFWVLYYFLTLSTVFYFNAEKTREAA